MPRLQRTTEHSGSQILLVGPRDREVAVRIVLGCDLELVTSPIDAE